MNYRYILLMLTGILNLRFLYMCPLGKFRVVNGNCTVCPPGFIGEKCSTTCPNGTYGAGCKHLCTCAECDPVSGCSPTSTDAGWETTSVTFTDVPLGEGPVHTVISLVLLIVILATVGLNFTVSIILLWRSSTNHAQQRHEDRTPKGSINQETVGGVELRADGYESPIIPTERPELRVYTELC